LEFYQKYTNEVEIFVGREIFTAGQELLIEIIGGSALNLKKHSMGDGLKKKLQRIICLTNAPAWMAWIN